MREARARAPGDGAKKLSEHAEWSFGEAGELAAAQAKTERVKRRRAEREGREYVPAAEPLAPPELLAENEDAWELFSACSTQLILGGFGGVAGVSHATLYQKMDVRQIPIEERYELEEKFRAIEVLFVKHCNQKSSSEKNG